MRASRSTGRPIPRPVRAVLAAVLALGPAAAPLPALALGAEDIVVTIPEHGDGHPPTDGDVTNAQLRWGLNAESGAGAFAGGCNFLSAGRAGDAGGARVWSAADGLYRAQDGAVRIEKPTATGGWERARWETRCLDARGNAVSVSSTTSTSGNQVVIDGGVGTRRDGELVVRWSGSFTVAYYGGMTYWSVTDPVLTLGADGNGRLTGTASGFGTSMEDMTRWEEISGRTVVLAEIRGADTAAAGGFSVVPEYLGVGTSGAGQVARTSANAAHWGSFPQSFVDFHRLTGQQGYWLTTGGVRDAAKPATSVIVSYDAAAPIAPPPVADADASPAPSNPRRTPPRVAPIAASAVPELMSFAANAPITTEPQRAGLVPGQSGALPPLVAPLLGSAAALSVGIIAVLSMMQALPWQRLPR